MLMLMSSLNESLMLMLMLSVCVWGFPKAYRMLSGLQAEENYMKAKAVLNSVKSIFL